MKPRRRRRMRRPVRPAWGRAAVLVGALVALAPVTSASARPATLEYYKARAFFRATIDGTYTAHGVAVDTQCYRYIGNPADGNREAITVTRTVDETLHFASVRPVRLEADRYLDNTVGAGTFNARTPITVTTTRTFAATAQCDPERPDPACGSKTLHLGISMTSRSSPLRLFYFINDGRVIFPSDPFDFGCRMPVLAWWGKLSGLGAPLPAAKLFNRSLKSFTLHAHQSKSSTTPGGGASKEQGHYDLSFAVKLVRLRH